MLVQWKKMVVARRAVEARVVETTAEEEIVAVVLVMAELVGTQGVEVGPGGASLAYLVAAKAVVDLAEGVWVVVALVRVTVEVGEAGA